MTVGTTWIKELSAGTAGDARPVHGARRASTTLTVGLGVGVGVSGVLARWGSEPTLIPYPVQGALSLVAFVLLLRRNRGVGNPHACTARGFSIRTGVTESARRTAAAADRPGAINPLFSRRQGMLVASVRGTDRMNADVVCGSSNAGR